MTQRDLTQGEFQALVTVLKADAHACPLDIQTRMRSGQGPPLEYRRDIRYRGHRIMLLLTVSPVKTPALMLGEYLSVMNLAAQPLPAPLLAEIVDAFFPPADPANDEAQKLRLDVPLPSLAQYIRLIPQKGGNGRQDTGDATNEHL